DERQARRGRAGAGGGGARARAAAVGRGGGDAGPAGQEGRGGDRRRGRQEDRRQGGGRQEVSPDRLIAVASWRRRAGGHAPGGGPAASLGKGDQPVAPARNTRKAGGDELDALLNKAIGNSSVGAPPSQRAEQPPPRPAHQASDDASLPDALLRPDIQRGMAAVKPHVNACYSQFNVPGIVNGTVTINPSGRVAAASAKDKFAGTPTGDCVARAVRAASFPRFKPSTGQMTVDYPFLLSK